ncbi:hypothetical protein [Stutzerimonas chloritidismutans]|uniref:hypothetical protein n=1 Tax=Stutzerimonas chloritidismutans TaxID=203192 RepID=UPI003F15E68C
MNLDDRMFFRLAVGLFIASLILPANGQFFAGMIMFIFSSFASTSIILNGNLDILSDPKHILGLFVLLMPFYNFLFIIALTRFWDNGKFRFSFFRVFLYACTIVSLIWGVMGILNNPDVFYPLALWALSFLFLSLAVAVRTEKNLTNGSNRSLRSLGRAKPAP